MLGYYFKYKVLRLVDCIPIGTLTSDRKITPNRNHAFTEKTM